MLSFKETRDVVVKGVRHHEDEKNDADLLRALALFLADGPPENRLEQKEKQMAAVEYGDRQQIQDA
jgi:hypothetical protein